jgi:polyferredoxin
MPTTTMMNQPMPKVLTTKSGKQWLRRTTSGGIDWRFWSQTFWAAIAVWVGWEFVRFVRHYETGALGPDPSRPAGVESFLPISGLLGLRDWIVNGTLNHIHPAATIVLGLALVSSALWKKSFCGWVCPVGFVSEAVGSTGRKVHRWRGKLPHWMDWPLRSVKYLLLAFFVWAIFFKMTGADLQTFIDSPYNRVADVKMMRFFAHIDPSSLYILLGLVVAGFVVSGFWCRFLCPYGALAGLASFVAPWKITRKASLCIDCNRCNIACPAHIPVAQLTRVRSDECNACLQCVAVCPSVNALELSLPRGRSRMPRLATVIAVTGLFFVGIGVAMATDHWQTSITAPEYRRRIQEIDSPKYQHSRGEVPQYTPED